MGSPVPKQVASGYQAIGICNTDTMINKKMWNVELKCYSPNTLTMTLTPSSKFQSGLNPFDLSPRSQVTVLRTFTLNVVSISSPNEYAFSFYSLLLSSWIFVVICLSVFFPNFLFFWMTSLLFSNFFLFCISYIQVKTLKYFCAYLEYQSMFPWWCWIPWMMPMPYEDMYFPDIIHVYHKAMWSVFSMGIIKSWKESFIRHC